MKISNSRHIFEKKYQNTKFHENPTVGSKLLHADGRTDIYDGAKSRFS